MVLLLEVTALSITFLSVISHGFGAGLDPADGGCKYSIVQSMPEGLELSDPAGVVATHESLMDIVENAKKSLKIASYYWALTAPDEFAGHPSAVAGQRLMKAISEAASNRKVKVSVVLDKPRFETINSVFDIKQLQGFATLKYLNVSHVMGSGIMHSKFIIADDDTFYVGSSNFDWRSYTQIKEIGLTFKNCPALAQDIDKIFETYMLIADENKVPDTLPDHLKTSINLKNPLALDDVKLFLASSPPRFNGVDGTSGRTDDIDGLLHILEKAQHKIDISVMNYSPRTYWPRQYWPIIDDALRRAATVRRVQVRLLFSHWAHSGPLEKVWYRSLNAIQSEQFKGGGIHVKLFEVPVFDDFQGKLDHARVKHDKYMVTDNGLYIGTSNWSGEYFTNTTGVGVVIEPSGSELDNSAGVIKTMQDIFERDFNSEYAHELD